MSSDDAKLELDRTVTARHLTLAALCLGAMAYIAFRVPWSSPPGYHRAGVLLASYVLGALADVWLVVRVDPRTRTLEWDRNEIRVADRALPWSSFVAMEVPIGALWVIREPGRLPFLLSFRVFKNPGAAMIAFREALTSGGFLR